MKFTEYSNFKVRKDSTVISTYHAIYTNYKANYTIKVHRKHNYITAE